MRHATVHANRIIKQAKNQAGNWKFETRNSKLDPRTRHPSAHGNRSETDQFLASNFQFLFSNFQLRPLGFNFEHSLNVKALQKFLGFCRVELPILGFDTKEEPVASGQCELRYVEHRMIRRRETV